MALDPKTKAQIAAFVNADLNDDLAKKYGVNMGKPAASPVPASSIDPMMNAGAVSPSLADALAKKYGSPTASGAADVPMASLDPLATAKPPVSASSLGLPQGAPMPATAPTTGPNPVDAFGMAQDAKANGGVLNGATGATDDAFAKVPTTDATAMNAVSAKMGGKDPFAFSKLTPGGAPPPTPMEAQKKAEAAELAKVQAGPAAKPTPKISAETTGFVPPSQIAAEQKKLAGVGGGPKPMGAAVGGVSKKPVDLLDKYLSPAEKAEAAHTLEFMHKSGQLDQAIADATAEGKTYIAQALKNAQEDYETMDAETATREAERQKVIDGYLSTEEKMAQDAANTKIDSNNWWASKDTAGQISTAVGVFLGGLATGLKGGENEAMAVVQRSIDRDIEAQKANLSSKYSALAAHRGLLATRMQAFGDERMAEQSARAAYAEQVQRQIQSFAATTDSDVAKVNAEKMSTMLDGQINQYKDNLAKLAEQRSSAAANAAAAAAAANAKEIRERNKALFTASLDGAKDFIKSHGGDAQYKIGLTADGFPEVKDLEGNVVYAPGGGSGATADVVTGVNAKGEAEWGTAKASSKEAAGKLGEASQTYAGLKQDIADLKKMHEGAGDLYDTAAEKAAAEAKLAAIQSKLAKLENTPLRGEAINILKSQIPSLDELLHKPWLTSDPAAAKLEQLEKNADESYKSTKATKGAGAPNTLVLQKPTDEEAEKE